MSRIMEDFSRQVNIFNPEEFRTPIHVIGAGAVGSWLAFSLAKMGIQNLHIYDFDEVGMHNLPNQLFGLNDIDGNKAIKIASIIRRFTGYSVRGRNMKIDGTQPMQGIVFMLTDTMASRKRIYDVAIKNNPNIDLLIETRMDLRGGRIYAIDPKNPEHTEEYEQTLYSDDESEVSACGISQTVLPTAIGIVSNAIWKLLNFINNEEFPNETFVDFSNEVIMTSTWGETKKNEFTRKDFIGKAIICKTKEDTQEILEILESLDFEWADGKKPTEQNTFTTGRFYYLIISKADKWLRYGTDKIDAEKHECINASDILI